MAAHKPPLTATRLILTALYHAGGAVADYGKFFNDLKRYQSAYLRGGRGYVAELKHLHKQMQAKQVLDALRRREFIHTKKIANRLTIELTVKGRGHIFGLSLRQAPRLPLGTYTLVSFDIPEQVRGARQQFRWFLRQAGFTKLQQSVWLSPRNVQKPLGQFVHQLKLEAWVTICFASQFAKEPRVF